MELLLGFLTFVRIFMLMMSILYVIKVIYDIAKVMVLKEGKVELGTYGLLLLGCSISYILTIIFT